MIINKTTLEITTNIGCRNMCRYCPQETTIKNYNQNEDRIPIQNRTMMSFNVFRECINKIPKGSRIVFAGHSEPWLNPDTTRMVLYAFNQGFEVGINTTFVGMNDDDFERIKNLPYSFFCVHLMNKEEHFMDKKKYFKLIEKICSSNIKNIFFMFLDVYPDEQTLDIVKKYGYFINVPIFQSRAGLLFDIPINFQKCFCKVHRLKKPILLPNGDLVFCCMDYRLQDIIGNLLIENFKDIYHKNPFLRIKKNFLHNDGYISTCRTCEFFKPVLSKELFFYFIDRTIPSDMIKNIKNKLKINMDKQWNRYI